MKDRRIHRAARRRKPRARLFRTMWCCHEQLHIGILAALILSFALLQGLFIKTPIPTRIDHAARSKHVSSPHLAFLIQATNSTILHLPRLLKALYHPGNEYLLHFDTALPPVSARRALQAAFPSSASPPNIHILPSEVINYQGISMVLSTLSAMTAALALPRRWRYFINLSAADYPLVAPDELRGLLLEHTGPARTFFSLAGQNRAHAVLRKRMTHFVVDDALGFHSRKRRVRVLPAKNPLAGSLALEAGYGEAWMIASRALCSEAVSGARARRILLALAFSTSAPEHFFATLVRNDPRLNATVVPHSMRLVVWSFRGRHAGQHPYFLDELPGGEDVVGESPLFFARKFRRHNASILDAIDRNLSSPRRRRRTRLHFLEKIEKVKW